MKSFITPEMIKLEEQLIMGSMKAHHIMKVIFSEEDPLRYVGGIVQAYIKKDRLVFKDASGHNIDIQYDENKYWYWARDTYNTLIESLRNRLFNF